MIGTKNIMNMTQSTPGSNAPDMNEPSTDIDPFASIHSAESAQPKRSTDSPNQRNTDPTDDAAFRLSAMQQAYETPIRTSSRLRVLSIEGSDPIGGAGTMADMKAFTAHGVFGYAAMTSVLAQNTQGVSDIVNMKPEFLLAQLNAVSDDAHIDAMKIGMLGTADLVHTVQLWLANLLQDYRSAHQPKPVVVLDPVMYAKSGDELINAEAKSALRSLIPLADIITPNTMELAQLAGQSGILVDSYEQIERLARIVASTFGVAVYAKGGGLALREMAMRESALHEATPRKAPLRNTTQGETAPNNIPIDTTQLNETTLRKIIVSGTAPSATTFGEATFGEATLGKAALSKAAQGKTTRQSNIQCSDILAVPDSAGKPGASDNAHALNLLADIPTTASTNAPTHATTICHTAGTPITSGTSATITDTDTHTNEIPQVSVTVTRIDGRCIRTTNVHGTGDTLSSTLAALRLQYDSWEDTARQAKIWMNGAIGAADSLEVGHGHGPIDFTWRHAPTGFTFTQDYWNRSKDLRERIRSMEFIRRMVDGSLDKADFAYYLHQDDLYLRDYTSLLAMASSRASTIEDRVFFADAASFGVQEGLDLHRTWLEHNGFDIDLVPMSEATTAYIGHEHRIADMNSLSALVSVVMPCYWVYSMVGQEMKRQVDEAHVDLADHPYGLWIRMYADTAFAQKTLHELHVCDRLARQSPVEDYGLMMDAALQSTEHEYRFFDQALHRNERR